MAERQLTKMTPEWNNNLNIIQFLLCTKLQKILIPKNQVAFYDF